MKKKSLVFMAFMMVTLVLSLIILNKRDLSGTISETNLNDPIWTIQIPEGESIVLEPIYLDKMLYVQTPTRVIAYDLTDGSVLWTTNLPVSLEECCYSDKNHMLVDGSFLVVNSQKNLVNVFNIETGELIWNSSYPFGDKDPYSGYVTTVQDIAIQKSYLLVSRSNTSVAAYDINDGHLVWISDAPNRTSLELFPFGNVVFVITLDSILAYDLASGDNLGTYTLSGDVISSYLDDDKVFLTFDNGKCTVAAFDLNDLQFSWCTKLNKSYFSTYTFSNSVDAERLYVFDNSLVSLSKDSGNVLWEIDPNRVFEHISVGQDVLYVIDAEDLYVVDKFDGAKVQQFSVPEDILSHDLFSRSAYPPVVTEDTICFFAKDLIAAYELPTR